MHESIGRFINFVETLSRKRLYKAIYMSYFFKPHIGEHYNNGGYNGLKIIILGESHHCGEGCSCYGDTNYIECDDFTDNTIHHYLEYKRGNTSHKDWMRTFTRFCNIYHGEQISNEKSILFWESVIFYNYVQKAMNDSRIPPSDLDFDNSINSFYQLLRDYSPDLVIVWGERLWDRLPNSGHWGEPILDGDNGSVYYYIADNKDIPFYSVYHPASSALTYEHHKYLDEFIRTITHPTHQS